MVKKTFIVVALVVLLAAIFVNAYYPYTGTYSYYPTSYSSPSYPYYNYPTYVFPQYVNGVYYNGSSPSYSYPYGGAASPALQYSAYTYPYSGIPYPYSYYTSPAHNYPYGNYPYSTTPPLYSSPAYAPKPVGYSYPSPVVSYPAYYPAYFPSTYAYPYAKNYPYSGMTNPYATHYGYPYYTYPTYNYPSGATGTGASGQLCGVVDGQYGCQSGLVCDFTKTSQAGVGICSPPQPGSSYSNWHYS